MNIREKTKYLVLHNLNDYDTYADEFSDLKLAEEDVVSHVARGNDPPLLLKLERVKTAKLHKLGYKRKDAENG